MTIINVYVFLLTFYGWLNDSEAGVNLNIKMLSLAICIDCEGSYHYRFFFYRTHVFAMLALLMNWQRKHSIVFKNRGFFNYYQYIFLLSFVFLIVFVYWRVPIVISHGLTRND